MTFRLAENPFKLEDKEPSVHLIPFGILVPCLSLFITKWTSIVFIYTTGSDEIECAMPGSWDESEKSTKRLTIFCKQNLFHVPSGIMGPKKNISEENHIDDK